MFIKPEKKYTPKKALLIARTKEELHEILDYNPDTGVFIWKIRNDVTNCWNARYAGTKAGFIREDGYLTISIFKERYGAHRLAYKMIYGEDPDCIDHINGIPDDNRIENLRNCTYSQNQHNRFKQKNNSSGYTGVVKCNKTWSASIHLNGKRINLGYYSDIMDAIKARKLGEEKYHKGFTKPI